MTQSDLTAALAARLRAAGCVFAEDEAALLLDEGFEPDVLEAKVSAREAGRPLEQVLGWAAFADLRLVVEPGVFVPRRRTELLAAEALARVNAGAVVVELCCGAGPVAAYVLAHGPVVEVHCADIDPVAVRCARRNTERLGGRAHRGDLYDALPVPLRGRVDVLVANAPYVPSDGIAAMPPEARDHEPRIALDGGPDGLDVQRRVAAGVREWLAPGGCVLVETSQRQVDASMANLRTAGLAMRTVRSESLDATVVIGNLLH